MASNQDRSGVVEAVVDVPQARPKRKAARSTKPKVTLELLKTNGAITSVFHDFPALFAAKYRGKGHEVSDLQRLLELFHGLQQRVIPSVTFDTFITQTEDLSSKSDVKVELNDLRQNLWKLVDDEVAPSDQDDVIADDPEKATGMRTSVSDDELLDLMEQDRANHSGAGPAHQATIPARRHATTVNETHTAASVELDDDELLALLAENSNPSRGGMPVHAAAPAPVQPYPAVSVEDEMDDEELLALAEEMHTEQQTWPSKPSVHAGTTLALEPQGNTLPAEPAGSGIVADPAGRLTPQQRKVVSAAASVTAGRPTPLDEGHAASMDDAENKGMEDIGARNKRRLRRMVREDDELELHVADEHERLATADGAAAARDGGLRHEANGETAEEQEHLLGEAKSTVRGNQAAQTIQAVKLPESLELDELMAMSTEGSQALGTQGRSRRARAVILDDDDDDE